MNACMTMKLAILGMTCIGLSGCAGAARLQGLAAPLMIELPPQIIDACNAAKSVAEAERSRVFWRNFDDTLWLKAGPEVRPVVFGPAFRELGPLWPPMAAGKPGAEAAWRQTAARQDVKTNLTRLSDYQLTLMRCYFPATGGDGLDPKRLAGAFEDLALSRYSTGLADPEHRGRMYSLPAWTQWSAFADACVDTGVILPRADRDAWRHVRRLTLLSLLLDAHHDPIASERRPTLRPPGLAGTSMEEIRAYVAGLDESGVRAALFRLQAMMSANPAAYPLNVPPLTK